MKRRMLMKPTAATPPQPPAKTPPKNTSAKKVIKSRGARKNRIFSYRGFSFLVTNKGDVSAIAIFDPATNGAEHQLTVPNSKVKQACAELAKVALAERTLSSLERKTMKAPAGVYATENLSVDDDDEGTGAYDVSGEAEADD